MPRVVIIATMIVWAVPALAQVDEQRDAQGRAAQLVTLAKLAPILCPQVMADDDAISALRNTPASPSRT